eukprot:11161224-Lingulodinium_polyedra.AAC.1
MSASAIYIRSMSQPKHTINQGPPPNRECCAVFPGVKGCLRSAAPSSGAGGLGCRAFLWSGGA